jgi:eukaryotic-like serine/threonine-protein kinase
MIGEVINNYRVLSLLGEGGMGAVYLAEHPFMGRKAAIKVLRGDLAGDRGLVERFMNEARAANAIRHPNIIDIIDVGRTPAGVPYLMMELLEGQSLAQRIKDAGHLEAREAIEIGVQTAAALTAAHGKGIVHRDLKPDNLFLVPDESRPSGMRIKVLDFGIAKLRGDLTDVSARTQAGALMGTPPYMSPEQCRGLSDEIDHRTDVYALGIILYEMLCGAPPFVSAGWGDIVLAHLTKTPEPPSAKNPLISRELEATILVALAKKREDRWSSMAELQAALRKAPSTIPDGPVAARATITGVKSPPAEPRATTTFRSSAGEVTPPEGTVTRRPARLVGLGLGAVALVVAIVLGRGALRGGGAQTAPASTSVPTAAPASTTPNAAPAPALAPAPAPAAPAAAPPVPPAPSEAPAPVDKPARAEHEHHAHASHAKTNVASAPKAIAAPPAVAPTPTASTPPTAKRAEKW